MNTIYNRRQALAMGGLAGLSLMSLAACGSLAATGGGTKLQLFFWGSTSRDKLTKQAIKAFEQKHSDVKITSQFTAFDAYWNKLSTQIAAGTPPDLIQMDMRYIAEYVKKGLLLDLSSAISNKTIDLSDFDQILLNGSQVNGKFYGIPLGGNYQAFLYDKDLLAQAKVTLPDAFSWDEFSNICTQLSHALGKGIAGTGDESTNITAFELWVRQRGRDVYTTDGKLGFTQEDAADWFEYWSKMRKSGACVPIEAAAEALTGGTPTTNLVKGQAVFTFTLSNLLDAFQALMKHKVGIHMPPTGGKGAQPGMYLKTSMLLSVSSKTKYTDDASKFVGFLINDPDGVKAISVERGAPGSTKGRALLQPQLTQTQKDTLSYIDLISKSDQARLKQILDPAGAGAVEQALQRAGQEVGFNRASVANGASTFFADAKKAIGQS
ncbi:ABC transporter substrate-binding protein [Ktedonospora formicarum]|uniref:Sugar ABC transporter substrate-binding protein n=1 Tax=Ktedonospora formicarum TaxID=2778364 RepID=A0A8J3MW34_9CHLR|nr:extracellular solute-binding protein [Ktedonospora formicarum]GHO51012.1 sugar ABC transporter substrate-binding protein [Ktedonospora formicarum]